MPVSEAQKVAAGDVIAALTAALAPGRGKRRLSTIFMDLVDQEAWPEYYEVILEPRCINGVQERVASGGYKDASEVFKDLELVFNNAMDYNEEGSQIWKDASQLKEILITEWKKRPVLPTPRPSPPMTTKRPTSSQASSSKKPVTSTTTTAKHQASKTVASSSSATTSTSVPEQTKSTGATGKNANMDVDVEVDVGGGPGGGSDVENEGEMEGEAAGEEMMPLTAVMARDAESDEIVYQLERGLRKWEGFGDRGWMEGATWERCLEIVLAIKGHKDIIDNTRIASVLDNLPEETTNKNLSFNYPLSLKTIENKARSQQYPTSKEFDLEFSRLFEKARRSYEPGTESYGNVLLLQRLYQALTSANPPTGPPYSSQTNFASIRAGPGTARPLHAVGDGNDSAPGVTTFRVSTRERTFVDEVVYKGWSIKLADWLHLSNPDDPSRPIIAQVFKCFVSDEISRKGQPGVTVCWYFRPEQTFHPANRQFWEGEVFKTGHFADHPLEDIIEKIACQFTARHIRGRPRPPFWYPGWPLYVCDSRYNDRERVFVRIKNWNSCVPEEVRKSTEFMPIYPFERTVFPRRFGSPFLIQKANWAKGGRWRFPGGIGESVEKAEGEKVEGGGTGRKRVRNKPTPSTPALSTGPSKGLYVGVATPGTMVTPAVPVAQPQQVYTPSGFVQPMPLRSAEDRSILTAAGGTQTLGSSVVVEKLSPDVAKFFDRDPDTNEVLWFSGPPMDVARPPGPRHSLDYLHFLAMKRKREQNQSRSSEQGTQEGTGDDDERMKRVKTQNTYIPAASEIIDKLWRELYGDSLPSEIARRPVDSGVDSSSSRT